MSRAKLTEDQAQIAVWVRADVRQRLADRAEAEKRSQKAIVEEALEQYLARLEQPPPDAVVSSRR